MELLIRWHEPCLLYETQQGAKGIYASDGLARIPAQPGIYVFAREFGGKVEPLYIGRSSNLRMRIKQHLGGNVRLMRSLYEVPSGKRVLLFAELLNGRGWRAKMRTKFIEQHFIKHALSEGYVLFNKRGTRTKVHTIWSSGKKLHHRPFPRKMNVEAA